MLALTLSVVLLSGGPGERPDERSGGALERGRAPATSTRTAPATSPATSPASSSTTSTALPALVARDLRGRSVSLRDQRGVVVVALWATWCEPCFAELKALDVVQRQRDGQGLTIFAVAIDGPETASQVRSAAARLQLALTVVHDKNGAWLAALHPTGAVPCLILFDRRGQLRSRHEGYVRGDEIGFTRRIDALLAESPP